jgi:hypothetical protein
MGGLYLLCLPERIGSPLREVGFYLCMRDQGPGIIERFLNRGTKPCVILVGVQIGREGRFHTVQGNAY